MLYTVVEVLLLLEVLDLDFLTWYHVLFTRSKWLVHLFFVMLWYALLCFGMLSYASIRNMYALVCFRMLSYAYMLSYARYDEIIKAQFLLNFQFMVYIGSCCTHVLCVRCMFYKKLLIHMLPVYSR